MMNCNCNCNTNQERAWVGTGLKFAITITAEGFDQATDDWSVKFICGRKSLEFDKQDMAISEDGAYIANVDTSLLGAGTLSVITYAHVPDEDWEQGYRVEVDKQDILYIKEV